MITINNEMDEVSIEIASSTQKATSGLNKLKQTLSSLLKPLSNLKNIGGKPFETLKKSSDKLKDKMSNLGNSFKNLQNNMKKKISFNLNSADFQNKFKNIKDKISALKESLKNIKLPNIFSTSFKALKQIGKSILSVFVAIKTALIAIKRGIETLFNAAKAFASIWFKIISVPFKPVIGSLKSIGSHLVSGLSKLKKWIGALFGIRSMYNAVRMAARAWLESQSAAAKQITTDFSYMKYALGSAVAPVMQYLVNLAYQLLAAFARIIYYITGINIFAKASAGSYASMAGSAGKTAKSAKETVKALQGFDELNNIDLEKNSDSGGGGGGGGAGMPSMDLSDLSSSTIFDDLLEKIKAGDWYGLGLEIGKKLNDAMDAIPWDGIQDKVRKGAKAVSDILNGLIDSQVVIHIGEMLTRLTETVLIGIDTFLTNSMEHFKILGYQLGTVFNRFTDLLPLAGQALGKYFQGILNIIDGFVLAFDWQRVGSNLAKGINNMFEQLDAGTAAEIVSQGMIKIFNTITKTIEDIDWSKIGKKVTEFIVGIDWNNIGKSISEAVSSLLDIDLNIDWSSVNNETIASLGTAFSAVTNTLQIFLDKLLEIAGSEQFQEWVQNTSDKITTISEKVNEIDWTPFVEALETIGSLVFDGIDILVTALKWIGENPDTATLIAGIAAGLVVIGKTIAIVSTVLGVLNAILTVTNLSLLPLIAIIAAITLAIGLLVAAGILLYQNWETIKEKASEVFNAVLEILQPILDEIAGAFKEAWEVIKIVWDMVKPYFQALWDAIKAIFSVVGAVLSGFFKVAWEGIKAVWNVVVNYFALVWAGIKAVFAVVKGILTGNFKDAWEAIKNVWNRAKSFFQSIWDGIKNVFSSVADWFGNIFKAAWNAVKAVLNTAIAGLETLINLGIVTPLNAVLRGLNGIVSAVGGVIGIDIAIPTLPNVSIPRLAKGGVLYDDTIVRVAEYSNANSNPEIVAPQAIIKNTVMDAFKDILRSDELKNLANKEVKLDLGIVVDLNDTDLFENMMNKNANSDNADTDNMSRMIGEYCYNAIKEGFNEQENEFNVNIGNEKVYRGIVRRMNKESNMYGSSTLKI